VTARPSFATPASSASKALSRHVSCMTKGEPATVSATNSPDVSIARLITNRQLIAASDWLHASVISANRHCPAAAASVPALITVVVSVVIAFPPTRPAHVNPHAARADVHTLRKRRCRSRGASAVVNICAQHEMLRTAFPTAAARLPKTSRSTTEADARC